MAKKTLQLKKSPQKKAPKAGIVSRTVLIQNRLGLHARAAANFVKTAFQYKAEIELIKNKQRANGKSIMGLLTLAAARGTEVTITAEGPDAQQAVNALADIIDSKFGEP